MPPSRTRSFIAVVVAWRWPLLALAVILAAAAWFPSRQVTFDRSIENMFSPRDPVMGPFKRFQAIFGSQEVLLAVYEDPQLMSEEGLQRLKQVSDRLRTVPGVRDVLSLAEINALVGQINSNPLARLSAKPPILDEQNQLAQAYRDLFEGYAHSADGQIAALACMIDPSAVQEAADPQRKIVDDVRGVLKTLPDDLPPGMVAGEPVMVVDGFRLVEQDGARLGIWSTLLLSITLAVSFRSWRWLLAPLAVVQFAVLLTKALLAILGLQLTLVSSMLTALVTVVGVATVTHLIVGFYEQRAEGQPADKALTNAATLLAWPILGAIATDMVGFGSLWWSSVGPVFDFGTMMVVGSLLVIPAIILIVPAIALAGHSSESVAPQKISSRLRRALSWSVSVVAAHPRLVLFGAAITAVFAILGSFRLTVETDFTKNFREQSELVRSYNLIESRLGGGGVWDVMVPAPDILDQAYIDRVLRLEQQLRAIRRADEDGKVDEPALTKVISLADTVDAAKVDPVLALTPPQVRLIGMSRAMPNFTGTMLAKDAQGQTWLRIMLRSRERLPAEQKKQTVREVEAAVREAFPGSDEEPRGEVTGYHVLVIALVNSLLRDQWIMFLLSCVGIAGMMLVAFRSITLAVLCLVPNVLPVLLVTGLMGWLGIRINMGAAMIAAVSMGLSVDSSIHYITAFRRGIRQGRTVREALDDVQQTIGRAMFLSTIAILVGFGVLCLSDFIPTIYFGALAGLTMLGGLAGNLVILPLLLLWTTPVDQTPQAASASG
jgi:predicted RND superfamily exporter protein